MIDAVAEEAASLLSLRAKVRPFLDMPPSPLFMEEVVAILARNDRRIARIVAGGHAIERVPMREREPGDDDPDDDGQRITVGEFVAALETLRGMA